MRNKKILLIGLPLLAALALTSCSKDEVASNLVMEEPAKVVTNDIQKWNVSIDAGSATDTRAISIGGNDGDMLYHNWEENDTVEVLRDGVIVGTLIAKVSEGNTAYAKLKGDMTGTYAVDDVVMLYYHKAKLDYTGQLGTIANVSTYFSFMEASSSVKNVDTENRVLTMSEASFSAMQAYLDLTFTDSENNPLDVHSLAIWAEGGKLLMTKAYDGTPEYATESNPLIIAPETSSNHLFFALRDENGAANNYHFVAYVGDNYDQYTYEGSKNLEYGHFYQGNVVMTAVTSDPIPNSNLGKPNNYVNGGNGFTF